MSRHAHLFKGIGGDFQPEVASKARWIEQFDEAITRVSFGWPSVAAYYAGGMALQPCMLLPRRTTQSCCCLVPLAGS